MYIIQSCYNTMSSNTEALYQEVLNQAHTSHALMVTYHNVDTVMQVMKDGD